jgi:2-C-methyl-D-erythritol 4-phosphate cytidylyltransferase
MRALVVLLAAGQGTRLGHDLPKALVRLRGRTLLDWSAEALARCAEVEAIQRPAAGIDASPADARLAARRGRAGRIQSRAGCGRDGCAARAEVLMHDAARCLVEPGDASAVLRTAQATGAALPVVPASDTVKWLAETGGRVERTLERARLGLAQTPQAFRVQVLREALDKAERDGFEGTDCASLVERLGVEVRVCAGRVENFKVTHPDDLARAEAVLARRGQA